MAEHLDLPAVPGKVLAHVIEGPADIDHAPGPVLSHARDLTVHVRVRERKSRLLEIGAGAGEQILVPDQRLPGQVHGRAGVWREREAVLLRVAPERLL